LPLNDINLVLTKPQWREGKGRE